MATTSTFRYRVRHLSLRSRFEHVDQNAFEVLARADGLCAQTLSKDSAEFEGEDQSHTVTWGSGLGSASAGELGGFLGVGDARRFGEVLSGSSAWSRLRAGLDRPGPFRLAARPEGWAGLAPL